jgi:hypothetical protein
LDKVKPRRDKFCGWQASIGASVREAEFVGEGKRVTVNGREFAGPVNVAQRASLQEVRFVGNGADDTTSASIAAGIAGERLQMDGTDKTVETQEKQDTPEAGAQVQAQAPAGGSAGGLRWKLRRSVKDAYVRRRPKAARYCPHKKREQPPGVPKIRTATRKEIRMAQALHLCTAPNQFTALHATPRD